MAKKKTKNQPKKKQVNAENVIGLHSEVTDQPITQTLEVNYMPYAMSVNVSRAFPEIDGFKPSHRKLLYTMYKMVMSIKNLPWTLLMVAITAAIAAGCYFSSTVLGLMLICVAGLHAYLCSLVFVHIFNEYMPEEEEKSDEDFHIADDTDED